VFWVTLREQKIFQGRRKYEEGFIFHFDFDSFLVFTLWSRRNKAHPGDFKDFDELKLEELLDVEVVTAVVEEKQLLKRRF
jgi:hypothetical protein